MAARQSVVVGLKVLGKRQFWSFKVVHALLGGLLTLAGAAGGVFVGDSLTKRIRVLDEQIASLDSRIETIRSVLAQFRVVQSNGILLGALSTSDGISSEFRESFTQLMFVLRRGPALALLGELYPTDVDSFRRGRDELDSLIERAVSQDRTREAWQAVLDFEMSRERQLMELQDELLAKRFELQADRRNLEASHESATFIGFVVQQFGFVVILLAGLVHQHAEAAGTSESARRAEGSL